MDDRHVSQIADDFGELKDRLKRYVETAAPSDKNLHFARFQNLDEESWVELSKLARDGLAKVQEHDEFFAGHDLYDDGMFWYELCLAISSTAVSYRPATGKSPTIDQVGDLADLLVNISRYAARSPSDMLKRNREALGNVLWSADDPTLINRTRRRAGEMAEAHVIAFVDDTIAAVEQAASESDIDGENEHS